MGADAVHHHAEGIRGRVELAVAHARMAQGQLRRHVGPEHRVHAVQRPGVDHSLRPAAALLVRLEQEHHAAAQRLTPVGEQLRRAQRRGDVHVVAAGVHHARGLGGEIRAGGLRQRQGVHVRAQRRRPAGQRAVQPRHHRRVQQPLGGDPPAVQARLDPLRGPELTVPQLRVAVKVPPQRGDLRRDGPGQR